MSERTARAVVPKWRKAATDRLRSTIHHYERAMADLVERMANEEQTRLLVTEYLVEGLGFDRFSDLDVEFGLRGNFVDYALKVDGEIVAFVECKAAGKKLVERHLRQVKGYLLDHPDVQWAVLTNGAQWQLYHIGVSRPLAVDLVLEADLLGDTEPGHRAGRLFFLTKESFKHQAIDALWKARNAAAPEQVAKALASASVLKSLRRELHNATGHLLGVDELGESLRAVLRPELRAGSLNSDPPAATRKPASEPEAAKKFSVGKKVSGAELDQLVRDAIAGGITTKVGLTKKLRSDGFAVGPVNWARIGELLAER